MTSNLLVLRNYVPEIAGHKLLSSGITYQLARGKMLGVTGPSGCGKSTMLRAIADVAGGKARPVSVIVGKANWDFLPQHDALPPWYTPAKAIRALMGSTAKDKLRAENGLVDMLGVRTELAKQYTNLSGGERQRVAILTLLLLEPDAVLIDEPFTALDVTKKGQALQAMLSRFEQNGSGGIIVSHDLDVLSYMADEVMVFKSDRSSVLICPNDDGRPASWEEFLSKKKAGAYNEILNAVTENTR